MDPARLKRNTWILAAACVLALAGHAAPAASVAEQGETMFRKGLLPSGKPFGVTGPGGAPVPGTTYACASCHLRSGLGAMDETPQALPITGVKLYRPLHRFYPSLTEAERADLLPQRFHVPPLRPAYTDATLGAAIRKGIDPNGRALNPVMPRFAFSDADLAILISYLKTLSAALSPGVTDTTLAFATVVTDETPADDRAEMLAQLEQRFQMHSNLRPSPTQQMGRMLSMQEMAMGFRKWTLDRWLLTGPADTWPRQLEAYYRGHPVFALVGGFSTVSWEPVHRFCETNRIPCLFPLTDLPWLSADDYYTLYFSRGLVQEGATAAGYLARSSPGPVVQLLAPGPEAAALAQGFDEAWKELGGAPSRRIRLEAGAPLTPALLAQLGSAKDTTLLLWTGPEAFQALGELPRLLDHPPQVFMSSTRLLGRLWDLPAQARAFTRVTFPFRRPGPREVPSKMGGKPVVVDKEYQRNDRRIASRIFSIVGLLTDRLGQLQRDFYRDHLLDLFDAMGEQDQTDYEQLNFGPGKRYVAEGCYVMQLDQAPGRNLIPMNEWIMY